MVRRDIQASSPERDVIVVKLEFCITKRFARRMQITDALSPDSFGVWRLGSVLRQFRDQHSEINTISDITNAFDGNNRIRISVTLSKVSDANLIPKIKQELCDFLEVETKARTE